MLRAAVALLLLANLAFFFWVRGGLAPGFPPPPHGEREPQRLAAQVQPELVRVLPATAASAAVQAARAAVAQCLEAGPFKPDGVAAAEAALTAALTPASGAEAAWVRVPLATPPRWRIYVGRMADAAARRTREAELRRLGLSFELVQAPAELAPGLVLAAPYATREDAESALAALGAPGRPTPPLRGARVLQWPVSPEAFVLRLPRATAEQQARLQTLPADALAGGFRPCAIAPKP